MLGRMLTGWGSRGQDHRALLLVALLTFIYYLDNFILGRAIRGFAGSYLLPALLWGFLALTIRLLPSRRPAAKERFKKLFCWLAFLGALACVLAGYGIGLVQGLGQSPYDLSLRGILINILALGSKVVGMEVSRAWFLNTVFRRRPNRGVVLTAFMYAFFWFSPNRMVGFTEALEGAKFVGSVYLPALSENVLASYLAYWGGALPGIIYRGTTLACHWLAPILPNLNWVTQALVGTFTPALVLAVTHQVFMAEVHRSRVNSADAGSPIGWIVTSALCVLLIWFSVGVFNYFPTAIVSGSMTPGIQVGDIVIVKRDPTAPVNVGDVILFKEDEVPIAHRVMEVGQDEKGRQILWTKGDANKSRDVDPVLPEQLVGPVVYKIPKAGWLTIWLRSRSS